MLVEFLSAIDAVNCAVRIPNSLKHHNERLTASRRMEFRIGLHLGDIMVDGKRIYGEGVNIAARIETLAPPGGICISDVIYKQIHSKLDLGYTDLGEQRLKNISEPVRVYEIFGAPTAKICALKKLNLVKKPRCRCPINRRSRCSLSSTSAPIPNKITFATDSTWTS